MCLKHGCMRNKNSKAGRALSIVIAIMTMCLLGVGEGDTSDSKATCLLTRWKVELTTDSAQADPCLRSAVRTWERPSTMRCLVPTWLSARWKNFWVTREYAYPAANDGSCSLTSIRPKPARRRIALSRGLTSQSLRHELSAYVQTLRLSLPAISREHN